MKRRSLLARLVPMLAPGSGLALSSAPAEAPTVTGKGTPGKIPMGPIPTPGPSPAIPLFELVDSAMSQSAAEDRDRFGAHFREESELEAERRRAYGQQGRRCLQPWPLEAAGGGGEAGPRRALSHRSRPSYRVRLRGFAAQGNQRHAGRPRAQPKSGVGAAVGEH